MTDLPQAAVDAAAEVIGRKIFGQEADEEDRLWARDILEAAAPHIAATERERIRQLALQVNAHYDCDPDYGEPFAGLLTDG